MNTPVADYHTLACSNSFHNMLNEHVCKLLSFPQVHGGTGGDDPGPGGRRSVRQALPYMLKPTQSEDRPLHRPLHCHRLDKATGGLMICAKTRPALSALW